MRQIHPPQKTPGGENPKWPGASRKSPPKKGPTHPKGPGGLDPSENP